MDIKTLLVILIPSILSIGLTSANMIFNYLKEKRSEKDKVWNAAKEMTLKVMCEKNYLGDDAVIEAATFFASIYNCLSVVESGEDLDKFLKEIQEKRLQDSTPQ